MFWNLLWEAGCHNYFLIISGNHGSLITVYCLYIPWISILIDNIEAHVEIAAIGVEKGNKQLRKAVQHKVIHPIHSSIHIVARQ